MPLIRRAGVGDAALLLTLIREFYEVDRHPYDEHRVVRALGPLLVDDSVGQVWLITDPPDQGAGVTGSAPDGAVTVVEGYAVLTWSWSLESGGRDCLLDEFYVRTRGRGLGGRALDELLHVARNAGAAAMFLETEAHNCAARRLYRRHGFRRQDSVWMARRL
ncbi:MAG TPA: GNAT family N-acetyltransferase [Geodermatophilus sp.]|nr:GNAT family N-acetyltransferase [Geodermatophilus sp.]